MLGVSDNFNVWDQAQWNTIFGETDAVEKGDPYTINETVSTGSDVTLTFYLSINDEWNNKSLFIYINGEKIWLGKFSSEQMSDAGWTHNKTKAAIERTFIAMDDFNSNAGGTVNEEQIYQYKIIVPSDMVTSEDLEVDFKVTKGGVSANIGSFTAEQADGTVIGGDMSGEVTEDTGLTGGKLRFEGELTNSSVPAGEAAFKAQSVAVSLPPIIVPLFVDQGSLEEWHGNGIQMRMR